MTTPNFIFESSLTTKDDKVKFLKEHAHSLIIMDLTCFDTRDFFPRFPQLVAATSIKLNLSETCEVFNPFHAKGVIDFLETEGLKAIEVKSIDGFFHLPRILSTIVNEAFYALEEGIASAEDIDRAMKFGVNYPEGPFRWVKGRESYVVTLLDALYASTKNKRYQVAQRLREASLLN